MNTKWLMVKQLDRELKEWQALNNKYGRPSVGWIKTLRMALRMTAEQLGQRLGLSRARIVQLEKAEIHDAVTLRTLRETANGMDCDLVYALIPRGNLSLEDIIKEQAQQIAKETVATVAHSMMLEAQTVDAEMLNFQQRELAKNLLTQLNKRLWINQKKSKISQQAASNKKSTPNTAAPTSKQKVIQKVNQKNKGSKKIMKSLKKKK